MKLYLFPASPRVLAIVALKNHLALDCELNPIDLGRGDQLTPEYLARQDRGPQLSENASQRLRHREGSGVSRLRPRAVDDRNGRKLNRGSRVRLGQTQGRSAKNTCWVERTALFREAQNRG